MNSYQRGVLKHALSDLDDQAVVARHPVRQQPRTPVILAIARSANEIVRVAIPLTLGALIRGNNLERLNVVLKIAVRRWINENVLAKRIISGPVHLLQGPRLQIPALDTIRRVA